MMMKSLPRDFDLAGFLQDDLFMLCASCGNDAHDHNYPFSRLCDACLASGDVEAKDIQRRINEFAQKYSYAPGHIIEFATWVLERKGLGEPTPANPDGE